MKDRILIIEDEEKIARFIELELLHEGYEAVKCGDGRTGLEMAESGGFSLVLLDIMLPELNGMEVLRRLRRTSDVPVIMLTARDAVMDKVAGLDQGADDYITKPFAIEELLARIRLALRRSSHQAHENTQDTPDDLLRCGDLTLSPSRHEVKYAGKEIELTSREFDLLNTLLVNKNIVLSRDTLLGTVWGYDYMGETNVVDVYVRYLRSKIDEVFGISLIQTVRGVGYVIRDENG
ncbi:MAG: response regulator transcription factor [Mogibacterium sp.]|jgi:DNA-binding response OmpR family regulator|nr:response regulator transcription factor [Mogibacterium sp.]